VCTDSTSFLAQVWLGIDHESIARTAYQQTGPTMPLGPLEAGGVPPNGEDAWSPDALGLFKDLAPFWSRIGGETVYQDAVNHVDAMWDEGILSSWADASTIVEDHVPHPAIVEGMEAAGWDIDNAEEDDGAPGAEGAAAGEAAGVDDGGLAPAGHAAAEEDREDDGVLAGDGKAASPLDTIFQYIHHDVTYVHMMCSGVDS
jgi:hypothetical protein